MLKNMLKTILLLVAVSNGIPFHGNWEKRYAALNDFSPVSFRKNLSFLKIKIFKILEQYLGNVFPLLL